MKIPEYQKQIVIYLFVGGGATIVEWGVFYLLDVVGHIHYAWATAGAFAVSTLANWALGRLMLFKKSEGSLLREIGSIYGVSIAGLLLNLAIMWVAINGLHLKDMIAKIIATAIVFAGNFLVRKFWIYRGQ